MKPEKLADLLDFDFDALMCQKYEMACQELANTDSVNHPSNYEKLSEAEKQALRYWIDHAVASARRGNINMSSYGLKHEFEREGFYVTNGQFKAAMLLAGHVPQNIHNLNWCFSIRQCIKSIGVFSEDYRLRHRYTVGCFDRKYAQLLLKAEHLNG